MPLASKTTAEVSALIMSNPQLALEITGSLLAGGLVAVKLRPIMDHLGLHRADLSDIENLEADLLDEEAKPGFFGRAVASVRGALLGAKMRGDEMPPQFGWVHGDYTVTTKRAANGAERVIVATHLLDEETHQLV